MSSAAVAFIKSRACLAISCVLVFGALAAGCGSSSSSSSSSGGSGTSTASGSSNKKHVTIGFVETFTSIPFYQQGKLGALAAGTEDGNAKVIVQGPAESTGSGEATIAQNLETSASPDGFASNPCVLPAWTQVDALLVRDVSGGNVLTWNCKPIISPTESSPIKTFVGVDDVETGAQAVKTSIEAAHLGPSTTGTALIAECEKGVPILDERDVGAIAETNKLLPKVNAVHLVTQLDQGPNTAAWTSAMSRYPKVVLGFGACDQDSASMLQLKDRHVGGNFATASVDLNPQELNAIKSGVLTAAVASAPWVQANVATKLLIAGARGTKLPQGWVNTGLYPVTKANVSQWIAASASPSAYAAFMLPLANKIMANIPAVTKPMADSLK